MISLKIKAILSFVFAYTAAFFVPILPFIIGVILLVAADLYTGIKAARHSGRYENKKASRGLRRTITKISQYFLAIILSQIMVVTFSIPTTFFPLTYIVSFYIAIVEFKSNLENISEVTGLDLWSVTGEHIKSFFNSKTKINKE